MQLNRYSVPMTPRVRTTPHIADASEITAAEELYKSRGIRVCFDRNAERAAAEARTADTVTIGKLRSWLLHPDERVPLAVFESKAPWRTRYDNYIKQSLNLRAIRTSLDEGVVWSPIHDAIGGITVYRMFAAYLKRVRVEVGPEAPTSLPKELTIGGLRKQLEAAPDPALVDELLKFRSYAIGDAIARVAGGFTDEQLKKVLAGDCPAHTLINYCSRSDLSDRHLDWILRWVLDGVERAIDRNDSSLLLDHIAPLGRLDSERLPSEFFDTLIELAVRTSSEIRHDLVSFLAHTRLPAPEQIARLAELALDAPHSHALQALIRQARVRTETLVWIAERTSNPQVRLALAWMLENHESAELTAALAPSNSRDVQTMILAHGTGPGFDAILRATLALKDPKQRQELFGKAYNRVRRHLQKMLPEPDYDAVLRAGKGETRDLDELIRVLVHDKSTHMTPSILWGWAINWSREHPHEALLLLRRASRSHVTPDETALLARSGDHRVRSMLIAALADVPLSPAATPEQVRRIRRPSRRR